MNKHSRCAQSAAAALLLGVFAVSVGSVAFAGSALPRISQERIAEDPAALTEAPLRIPTIGCGAKCQAERDKWSQACLKAGSPTEPLVRMCLDMVKHRYRACMDRCLL